MAETHLPGKIFVGGLNIETRQKRLQVIFERFGPVLNVILMRDRETKKSRGFAFITFKHAADAKNAVKKMNGVSLDGKRIKVEQARRPSSLERGRKQRPQSFLRARGCPSRGGNLDGDRYTDMSSSGRHFTVKRSSSSRRNGGPSKRPATSALTSNSGLRGQEPRGRQISRNMPRREPVASRTDEYPLPRDDDQSSNDSYSRRYASTSRGYSDYGNYSSQEEHTSEVFSDHAGYRGGHNRDFSDYLSGSSYRDTDGSYGNFREAPSARWTYTGNNHYDDYSSSRDGYGGEIYSNGQSDIYSSGYEHSGREVLPPVDREYFEHGGRQGRGHSPMDRLYIASRETYNSSSRFGGSHGDHAESRYESGGRY